MNYTNFVIMIRFWDNDFSQTFRCVLMAVRAWLQWSEEWEHYKNKEELVKLINRLSPIAYDHVQNTHGSTGTKTHDYLQVDTAQILVDAEVDEWLSDKADQGNCEWFVLDMRIPVEDQQIFSV